MRTAQAVAWKEIQIYFSSPTAYIVGLIFLALTGFFFTQDLGDPFPEATLVPFFDGAIVIFILLAPALTMRLLAEESKLGTIELLLTSPVRDWEIIAGKYIASLTFFLVLVALSFFYAILLFVYANPDPGPIYAGYLSSSDTQIGPFLWTSSRTVSRYLGAFSISCFVRQRGTAPRIRWRNRACLRTGISDAPCAQYSKCLRSSNAIFSTRGRSYDPSLAKKGM